MKKRILSMALACCMMLTMMPGVTHAEGIESGTMESGTAVYGEQQESEAEASVEAELETVTEAETEVETTLAEEETSASTEGTQESESAETSSEDLQESESAETSSEDLQEPESESAAENETAETVEAETIVETETAEKLPLARMAKLPGMKNMAMQMSNAENGIAVRANSVKTFKVTTGDELYNAFKWLQTEKKSIHVILQNDITVTHNLKCTMFSGITENTIDLDLNGKTITFTPGDEIDLANYQDLRKTKSFLFAEDNTWIIRIEGNGGKIVFAPREGETRRFTCFQINNTKAQIKNVTITGFNDSAIKCTKNKEEDKKGLTMENVQITDCEAWQYGGGIYVGLTNNSGNKFICTGYVDLKNCTITNCKASKTDGGLENEGGGIYVGACFNVNLENTRIENCHADSDSGRGAGVYVATHGRLNMYDGSVITGNEAATGGGVALWGGEFYLYGGTLKNNAARGSGNELAMLYGTQNIYSEISGGSVIHDTIVANEGKRGQIMVNGDNSELHITGGTIDLSGGNYGFSGTQVVKIFGGYIKANGKVRAFDMTPVIEDTSKIKGAWGAYDRADGMVSGSQEIDFTKQGVILAEKNNWCTVTFENPEYMGTKLDTDTPASLVVPKGSHLVALPELTDRGNHYFFNGWWFYKGEWLLDTRWTSDLVVEADTALHSDWVVSDMRVYYSGTLGMGSGSVPKYVTNIQLNAPYGYRDIDADEGITVWNYGSADGKVQVLSSMKNFTVEAGAYTSGLETEIEHYDRRNFVIRAKTGLEAGTYSESFEIKCFVKSGSTYVETGTFVIPVTLTVGKATPSVRFPRIGDITYGQMLSDASVEGGMITPNISGTFTWSNPNHIPNAGDGQTFQMVMTPDDTRNYDVVKQDVTINVRKAKLTDIAEPTVANTLTYGQTLEEAGLSAGWQWENPDEVPTVSNDGYAAYYEIDDESNYDLTGVTGYDSATKRITRRMAVTVQKAATQVTEWPMVNNQVFDDQTLGDAILTGGSASKAGTFTWKNPQTALNQAGTQLYDVVFTPDDPNYESVEGTVSVTVTRRKYDVIYDPGMDGTGTAQTVVKTYGEALTLAGVLFLREGYVQDGWTTEDGSEWFELNGQYDRNEDITLYPTWDKIVTKELPFVKKVTLGDNGVPSEETFLLEVFGMQGDNTLYPDVTYTASVTTDGAGTYAGLLQITGPESQVRQFVCEGFYAREVQGDADGWTYSDVIWRVEPLIEEIPPIVIQALETDEEPEMRFVIYPMIKTEFEEGEFDYIPDRDHPAERMEFENIYTVHEHVYTLKYDETTHWNECVCGDIVEKEAHRFGDWITTKEATETEKGEKEHICSVCRYTEKAEIPMIEKKPTPQPPKDNAPHTGDDSSLLFWLALAVVSGGALAGSVVYRKKRLER